MTTHENTSSPSPADVIEDIFDIQAIAISAAALAGSELGGGCHAERAMLQVGAMLAKAITQIEMIEWEGGAA